MYERRPPRSPIPEERIHRTQHDRNYTVIANILINDRTISREAVGVLVWLLSKPDDWRTYRSAIAKEFGLSRREVDRIFRELEEAGYLVRKQSNKGGMGKGFGEITYDVYEDPRDHRITFNGAGKRRKTGTSCGSTKTVERTDVDSTRTSEHTPPRSADSTHSGAEARFASSANRADILSTDSHQRATNKEGTLGDTYGAPAPPITNGSTPEAEHTRARPRYFRDDDPPPF